MEVRRTVSWSSAPPRAGVGEGPPQRRLLPTETGRDRFAVPGEFSGSGQVGDRAQNTMGILEHAGPDGSRRGQIR